MCQAFHPVVSFHYTGNVKNFQWDFGGIFLTFLVGRATRGQDYS